MTTENAVVLDDNNNIVQEPAAEPQSQPDGVVVLKKVKDDGSIYTEVSPIGKAQATEVQTLLELGVIGWRKQIGLA